MGNVREQAPAPAPAKLLPQLIVQVRIDMRTPPTPPSSRAMSTVHPGPPIPLVPPSRMAPRSTTNSNSPPTLQLQAPALMLQLLPTTNRNSPPILQLQAPAPVLRLPPTMCITPLSHRCMVLGLPPVRCRLLPTNNSSTTHRPPTRRVAGQVQVPLGGGPRYDETDW